MILRTVSVSASSTDIACSGGMDGLKRFLNAMASGECHTSRAGNPPARTHVEVRMDIRRLFHVSLVAFALLLTACSQAPGGSSPTPSLLPSPDRAPTNSTP